MRKWVFILFAFSLGASAQIKQLNSPVKRNTFFIEFGGQSVYASISYDRLFRIDKKIRTSFTTGLAILPLKNYFFVCIPVSYNFIYGQKNNHLELGAGLTFLSDNYESRTYSILYFSPKVAYRFQKPSGGLFFRACAVPLLFGVEKYSNNRSVSTYSNSIIYNPDHDGINWWFGLGIGYTL